MAHVEIPDIMAETARIPLRTVRVRALCACVRGKRRPELVAKLESTVCIMGCHTCLSCKDTFEAYDADEYAWEGDRDSDEDSDMNCDFIEGNYDTCPRCLEKEKKERKKEKLLAQQTQELRQLRTHVVTLKAQFKKAHNALKLCHCTCCSTPKRKRVSRAV